MAKRGGNNAKCQKYLGNRTRIKNKTEALNKRVAKLKDDKKENVLRSCRIGRKKEGFSREEFKFKKKGQNVKTT